MAYQVIQLNPGSGGQRVAVDRDTASPSTGDYQLNKLVFGGEGTFTHITSSVGFPVNIVQNSLNSSTVADNAAGSYLTGMGIYDTSVSPNVWRRAIGTAAGGIIVDLGANNDVTTELASAAALSDTFSNPTTAPVGSFLMGYDTESSPNNWRRIRTNSQGHLIIDHDTESIALADNYSNTQPIPSDHAGNAHPFVTFGYMFDGSTWDRVRGDSTNGLTVNLGANNDIFVNGSSASGGGTPYKNIDVDETEDQVKASAGRIYNIHAINLTASVLYLHLYNATAASVTVGSTTPTNTYPVPTLATTNGTGFVLPIGDIGMYYDTAITIACTTDVAGTASPVAGPAANGLVVNMVYV